MRECGETEGYLPDVLYLLHTELTEAWTEVEHQG